MSADRWTECPKCEKKRLDLKKRLDDLYGKIKLAEYQELQRQYNILENARENTLREDFEQGINEGIYEVIYSAHCSVCGFTFKYDFVKDILI